MTLRGEQSSRNALTHLELLEAETIHIMREVLVEAEKPVLMHSVCTDSTVMLHLVREAIYSPPPLIPPLSGARVGDPAIRSDALLNLD